MFTIYGQTCGNSLILLVVQCTGINNVYILQQLLFELCMKYSENTLVEFEPFQVDVNHGRHLVKFGTTQALCQKISPESDSKCRQISNNLYVEIEVFPYGSWFNIFCLLQIFQKIHKLWNSTFWTFRKRSKNENYKYKYVLSINHVVNSQ